MIDQQEFDRILKVLDRAIRETRTLLKRFKVAPRTKRHKLFALMVLNEIVRKGDSVVAMANVRSDAGINTIARAALENFADFKNLFKHGDEYTHYMVWAAANQLRSFLQPMTDKSSDFATSFEKRAKRSMGLSAGELLTHSIDQMQTAEDILSAKFKNKDGKVQRRDLLRFELAGLVGEYNALYRHLSVSAHGRIFGMVDGVLDGEDINWPPSEPVIRPLVALDCICAMLLEASVSLARKYNKPIAPIKTVIKDHVDIRGGKIGLIGA